MKNKSSIFKKQFLVQSVIIIVSFFILGVGLINSFSNFFINEKKEALLKQGENIEAAISKAYYWGGIYSYQTLKNEIYILNKYLDSSFIFVDEDYTIKMISNDIDSMWLGKTLNIPLENKDYKEYIQLQGNMGGIFKESVFTVGYNVFIEDIRVGTIFMNSPLTELKSTVQGVYEIILLLTLLAIAIGFVFIYISAIRISEPLVEINNAAKIIASGELEKRININRKDEIGQLAESFNEMAQSLFEQETRRREFISNISHDIRSPLTSIKGFLQAILDNTIPKENQEKYIKVVLDEVERLTILSNNILEINKIHFNIDIDYSQFDINELIRRTVINLESRILQKNIKLNIKFFENTTFVEADLEKIQRVLYNLLDNAIKFTQNEGQITIETDLKEDTVVIAVKDTGCGISKEDQKRIFDRFYKTDTSRGQDKKGSGLGLSIVKDFILAHNQKIGIKSQLGNGSEFIFTLKKV